ncbi:MULTISPECIES: DUF2516 family protein [Rhodococcus]|jgi:hypothetical protein|uniref:DUF2516 domain-containing protein n=2 Tax=Rhodococcus TaxID=1827 RepID=A0A1H7J6E2_9NOCA|nr:MULTISPECIES: DUF2516 family protein [Rhodococcus]AQA21301.1 hypothetical protein BTZ20_1127 [Rhodococcus sp. MTM3W5.2]MBP1162427.1 Na+-translocating ferredoxin:NAD+ oxidoreductase RNF subunit RnfB [Rhodococcus sp. PvR099]MCZ4555114.1 DUF2516 family protein [Rhodococcus maanshanensis]PTR45140.1 uncharacterized protein DUF2516 [Rhodococcus sp. OK611]TJZ79463.1 DUF2516 family protein [Rhodococcus oryzae]
MPTVNGLTGLIMLALQLAAIAAGVFAVFHAIRQRTDAFTAVDKLSKPIWLGILLVALLVLLLPFGMLFWMIAVVAICVYLVDVRPRVDEVQRGPRW